MDLQRNILKGTFIFGVLGIAIFLILIIAGIVINALGLGCNCFKVFSLSLIGAGILFGFAMWYYSCSKNSDGEDCKGLK
ncbi:MAG: hypothetical protein GXO49_04835 [Chlorobi bacterium]|nr:hypothetical protein [Chlorobiota bacterium]